MMEQWPELYERKDYRQELSPYTFCPTLALKNIKFTPIFKLLNFNPNPIMTYNVCHIKFSYVYIIFIHIYQSSRSIRIMSNSASPDRTKNQELLATQTTGS